MLTLHFVRPLFAPLWMPISRVRLTMTERQQHERPHRGTSMSKLLRLGYVTHTNKRCYQIMPNMPNLINSRFRVRPSSKFAHTVDRVKEYHNYIGYLALSISRVLLIGGKYYKIHIGSAALLNPPPFIDRANICNSFKILTRLKEARNAFYC